MTIDTKDILNSILASVSRIDYIKPEEIPNIDLYMDQITTFMEDHLASSKRHPEDKILTLGIGNIEAGFHMDQLFHKKTGTCIFWQMSMTNCSIS